MTEKVKEDQLKIIGRLTQVSKELGEIDSEVGLGSCVNTDWLNADFLFWANEGTLMIKERVERLEKMIDYLVKKGKKQDEI